MEVTRANALDILASVVSSVQQAASAKKISPEHRVSCHRCGNIRKRKLLCPRNSCPHIFCGRCADKMKEEHGNDVFVGGCPVCLELCCCSNKTVMCNRQNHCYRKCPATKGKHFKEEAISGDIGITDFAGNAPALEILAQVVARPNDDPMGTVHTSELLKERGPKRKFSESSVGLVLPGKSSQRKSDGLGLTPSSFSPPIPAGWPIDSIASVSSSGGLHHAGRSGMSGDGRHMLSQASSMLPHHGFLGLSPHGMENTSDQTMLFLGSNTPNQHLAANRASGMGADSYPSIPSHHYDMSSLMTSSAVIGPGHMSLPGAGTWSTQHQSFNYILPRESDPYGPSRHTMPFPLHAGGGFALSPRAVTTANTPTLLAHIAPTPPETGRSGILQQLPLHMGGGSETQFRESYIPYSPSGPSISSDRGDSAAHLLLGVSGQGMPPVSKLHGEEELAMSVASSTKTVGESRSGEKQSNRDRE